MDFPASFLRRHTPIIILMIVIISPNPTNSQIGSGSSDTATNFQPSLAIVIGVLTIMFSLTFLLLIYAKCCHRSSSLYYRNQEQLGNLNRSTSRSSGIDKTLIESLPFFRFSTLKGWRDGLECSVCLSKFEDVEILRLLPKCKHAFHINCVDQWLEKHSSCPLCRCTVSEEDVAHFAYSNSLRFLSNNQSEVAREGSNLELFIERQGSARFGSGRSFRKIEKWMKTKEEDESSDIRESRLELEEDHEEIFHKFNHKIIVSNHDHNYDLMMKNRWSNVSSSDLMLLKSEMINSMSSDRFDQLPSVEMEGKSPSTRKMEGNDDDDHHLQVVKIKEEMERKREFERKIEKFEIKEGSSEEHKAISSSFEQRSMSEIIVHPRFLSVENNVKEGEISVKEERLRRLWLPIARRTVQWFANRERSPNPHQQLQVHTQKQESLDV